MLQGSPDFNQPISLPEGDPWQRPRVSLLLCVRCRPHLCAVTRVSCLRASLGTTPSRPCASGNGIRDGIGGRVGHGHQRWRSTELTQRAKECRRRHTARMNSTTATWPEWKAAKPGQRVRMNRTGSTGTVLMVNRFGVRVQWDESDYAGVVVAPAFDLTAI